MAVQSFDTKEVERAFQWLGAYWGKSIEPEWHDATTIDEALSLLEHHGHDARIFAGGTDLVGLLKNRILGPKVLVNIKPIRALRHIALSPSHLEIGALTKINDLERSLVISDQYPLLFQAAQSIGSPHIRNMASIAGNLCQETRCWYYRRSPDTGISFDCRRKGESDLCYALNGENEYHAVTGEAKCVSVCPSDLASVLLAMDARIRTVHGKGGRLIPVDQFYTCFGNKLNESEMISSIQIPIIEPGVKQRFIKFRIRQTIDFAIISVAAMITLDHQGAVSNARIVLGGVSSTPIRAVEAEEVLMGERMTEHLALKAGEISVTNLRPLSKNAYKIRIAQVLVKRALLA